MALFRFSENAPILRNFELILTAGTIFISGSGVVPWVKDNLQDVFSDYCLM